MCREGAGSDGASLMDGQQGTVRGYMMICMHCCGFLLFFTARKALMNECD